MIYIRKNKITFLYLITSVIFGCFIGEAIKDMINDCANTVSCGQEFIRFYSGELSHIPIRYATLLFCIFLDFSIFNPLNYTSVIFRQKSFMAFLFKNMGKSIKYISLSFLLFNLPIVVLNYSNFISNFEKIILLFLNEVIIALLCISIIRLIDSKVQKMVFSSGIFLICFALVDFIIEHYAFYSTHPIISVELSDVFILPVVCSNYFLIFLIIIMGIFTSICLTCKFMIKGDYSLNERQID